MDRAEAEALKALALAHKKLRGSKRRKAAAPQPKKKAVFQPRPVKD